MSIQFTDRDLAHIQIAIAARLRLGESFFLSWQDNLAVGSGRSSIWISTSILLHFSYDGGVPPIEQSRLRSLMRSPGGAGGMQLDSAIVHASDLPRSHV